MRIQQHKDRLVSFHDFLNVKRKCVFIGLRGKFDKIIKITFVTATKNVVGVPISQNQIKSTKFESYKFFSRDMPVFEKKKVEVEIKEQRMINKPFKSVALVFKSRNFWQQFNLRRVLMENNQGIEEFRSVRDFLWKINTRKRLLVDYYFMQMRKIKEQLKKKKKVVNLINIVGDPLLLQLS